jgi:hypothetical protein
MVARGGGEMTCVRVGLFVRVRAWMVYHGSSLVTAMTLVVIAVVMVRSVLGRVHVSSGRDQVSEHPTWSWPSSASTHRAHVRAAAVVPCVNWACQHEQIRLGCIREHLTG